MDIAAFLECIEGKELYNAELERLREEAKENDD